MIHDGLAILFKYEPSGGACAEHDELFACSVSPDQMQPEDVDALATLHWYWDSSLPSWKCFT
jgi:hypothetical protein